MADAGAFEDARDSLGCSVDGSNHRAHVGLALRAGPLEHLCLRLEHLERHANEDDSTSRSVSSADPASDYGPEHCSPDGG